MYKIAIAGVISGLLFVVGLSRAEQGLTPPAGCQFETPAASPLDAVLEGLQKKASELTSYECKVDYLVSQPLLESKTHRTGMLYYARFDQRSYLRIDFRTLQQDEEPQQEYREQFIFDGVWLRRIDYQTRTVERRQIAEPNKPVDAFALASRQVPVLGFSNVADLRKQFDVELVPSTPQESPTFDHLHLKVKPDSAYKDDYTAIDFWIDRKVGLPARVTAVGAEADIGDIYEIKLLEPRVNQGVDKSVFDISAPEGFSLETIPLEKQQVEQ